MRLAPEDMSWTFAILDVYLSLDDNESARDLLVETLEDQESSDLEFLLAEVYYSLEEKGLSIQHFNKGLELDPRPEVFFRLAQVHEEMENPFLAMMTLQEGVSQKILGEDAHVELGRLYFAQKSFNQALEQYYIVAKAGKVEARTGFLLLLREAALQPGTQFRKDVLTMTAELYPGDEEMIEAIEYVKGQQ